MRLKLAFYGSSLLSSYWNGAATYYRGILKNLATHGWQITFYEPDAFDRQQHKDLHPPHWAKSVVWSPTQAGLRDAVARAADADVVVKASGVGVWDTELLEGVLDVVRPGAVPIFWDVDAPATLAEMQSDLAHPVRRALSRIHSVFTYGGGPPVIDAYRAFGARRAHTIYNGLDPDTHFSVGAEKRFQSDLALLANRLPDREARIDTFFFDAARALLHRQFLLGGNGWADKDTPTNVRKIGHVYVDEHNALNCSALAILNVARDSMATMGFSPATRVFEAAGAGACIITDAWEGVEQFFAPESEILIARDGQDVAQLLQSLTPTRARRIGEAARRRALDEHTYGRRAAEVDTLLRRALAGQSQQVPA